MTRYCVSEHTDNGWESIALFADTVPLRAIIQFAKEHMKAFYDLTMKEGYDIEPRDNVQVSIIGTGEILYNWKIDRMDVQEIFEDYEPADIDDDDADYWDDGCPIEDYEPADIDDDCGFDPYEGCFTFDC